jgi:hypothetical protein
MAPLIRDRFLAALTVPNVCSMSPSLRSKAPFVLFRTPKMSDLNNTALTGRCPVRIRLQIDFQGAACGGAHIVEFVVLVACPRIVRLRRGAEALAGISVPSHVPGIVLRRLAGIKGVSWASAASWRAARNTRPCWRETSLANRLRILLGRHRSKANPRRNPRAARHTHPAAAAGAVLRVGDPAVLVVPLLPIPLWGERLQSRPVLRNIGRLRPDQQRRSVPPVGVPARAAPGTHAEHAATRFSVAGLRQHAIHVCGRRARSTRRITARLVTRSPVRLGRRLRTSGRRPSHVGLVPRNRRCAMACATLD